MSSPGKEYDQDDRSAHVVLSPRQYCLLGALEMHEGIFFLVRMATGIDWTEQGL